MVLIHNTAKAIRSWIDLERAFCHLNKRICNLAEGWHIYLRILRCWLDIHQNQHNLYHHSITQNLRDKYIQQQTQYWRIDDGTYEVFSFEAL